MMVQTSSKINEDDLIEYRIRLHSRLIDIKKSIDQCSDFGEPQTCLGIHLKYFATVNGYIRAMQALPKYDLEPAIQQT